MEYGSYKLPWNKRKVVVPLLFTALLILFTLGAPNELRTKEVAVLGLLFLLLLVSLFYCSQRVKDYVYEESYEWIKRNINCPVCGGKITRCENVWGGRGGDIYELQCGNCRKEFILTPKFGRSGLVLQDKAPGASAKVLTLIFLISIVVIAVIVVYFLLKGKW
ncbi:MAG: hypothetical protein QXF56_01640 [Candidatus Micrarchaeia archaeon]